MWRRRKKGGLQRRRRRAQSPIINGWCTGLDSRRPGQTVQPAQGCGTRSLGGVGKLGRLGIAPPLSPTRPPCALPPAAQFTPLPVPDAHTRHLFPSRVASEHHRDDHGFGIERVLRSQQPHARNPLLDRLSAGDSSFLLGICASTTEKRAARGRGHGRRYALTQHPVLPD